MAATEPTTAAAPQPEWMQRSERGCRFWLAVMRRLSLWCGRRPTRLIVYGIAAYFLLAAPAARRASRAYLDRALGRPATWRDLYRHILCFASTIHDRIYLLNGGEKAFTIHWFGDAALHALHAAHGGFLLFGAHLGSFELMRTLAHTIPNLKVSMAMYPDNARQLNAMLSAVNPRALADVIPLGQLDSMLSVHNRLQQGEMIGILADRASGADHYQCVNFLGAPAHFPTGPFRLAAMLREPVYFMAGLYQGDNVYAVHFEPIADFSDTSRATRDAAIAAALARYVAVLEKHCRAHPYNWFNFFDFWGSARDEN